MKFTQVSFLPQERDCSDSSKDGYVKVGLYRGVQEDAATVPVEIVVEDTGLVGISFNWVSND